MSMGQMEVARQREQFEPGVAIEAKAGDVVAPSSRLPHITGPNHTTGQRRDAIPLLRAGRRVTWA